MVMLRPEIVVSVAGAAHGGLIILIRQTSSK